MSRTTAVPESSVDKNPARASPRQQSRRAEVLLLLLESNQMYVVVVVAVVTMPGKLHCSNLSFSTIPCFSSSSSFKSIVSCNIHACMQPTSCSLPSPASPRHRASASSSILAAAAAASASMARCCSVAVPYLRLSSSPGHHSSRRTHSECARIQARHYWTVDSGQCIILSF